MSDADRSALLSLEPVPTLLRRAAGELAATFGGAPDPSRPLRVSRAPGRLDVMGGIADYTGSLVCEMPLDRAAAVLSRPRADRQVQVVSLNLLDDGRPFTVGVSLDHLANASIDDLRREFTSDAGRTWAGYLIGCLAILHAHGYVDLADPSVPGMDLALLSTVPLGAGVSSSAAVEVATMCNLIDGFDLRGRIDGLRCAVLCQEVENRVVGAPCGLMDQVASCLGEPDALLRMVCQPHDVKPWLPFPKGIRAVGINSNVKHSVGGGQYGRTRCAAFMGHAMILAKMRQMADADGKRLVGDPTNGYLANLSPDDYKGFFRPFLPETLRGEQFLEHFDRTADTVTRVETDVDYAVQAAADHHVLEARRVRQFEAFLSAADRPGNLLRQDVLNKAGHLMYASHKSYTDRAMLGADACDLLVDLVRQNESAGLYGAKITGGGSGGTVAVLCDDTPAATQAIERILSTYAERTGRTADLFAASSPGAWSAGTAVVTTDRRQSVPWT